MRVAVLSSIYGGYDQPKVPAAQDMDCEWLLVTDQPDGTPDPWKPTVEARPGLPPRLAAKVAKCRPDLYTTAPVTVWVDGHFRIIHPGCISWAVRSLGRANLAMLTHPNRTRLSEEAELSARLPKYAGMPLAAQTATYLEAGHPDSWGLWACGLIVRRTSPTVQRFGDAWLAEQVRWSIQDQLSAPPLLRTLGLEVATLAGPLVGHWGFTLARHADGTL